MSRREALGPSIISFLQVRLTTFNSGTIRQVLLAICVGVCVCSVGETKHRLTQRVAGEC